MAVRCGASYHVSPALVLCASWTTLFLERLSKSRFVILTSSLTCISLLKRCGQQAYVFHSIVSDNNFFPYSSSHFFWESRKSFPREWPRRSEYLCVFNKSNRSFIDLLLRRSPLGLLLPPFKWKITNFSLRVTQTLLFSPTSRTLKFNTVSCTELHTACIHFTLLVYSTLSVSSLCLHISGPSWRVKG